MLKQSKVRLSALKMAQLNQSDQSWILNQLPKDISQKITEEIKALSQFGLENPEFLVQQIEQENKQKSLSKETQLVIANYTRLSIAESYLYFQTLSDVEKSDFMQALTESQRSELKLFVSRHSKTLSEKFKKLFVISLMKQLGENE